MRLHRAGALLCCTALLTGNLYCLPVSAAETPAVVYDGAKKEFRLEHADGTDLFPEFKEMMPGDSVTQEITVAAENTNGPVTVYLTAGQAEEDMSLFEQVYLTVEADGNVISGGSLGEQSGLRDGVKLFTFEQPGEKTLEVTLDVSEEAGNELMDAQAEVDWTFTVQDYGAEDSILIKSMDMTAYTGGNSISEDSFPTARYSVYTPDGVELSDLTFSIEGGSTFTVEQEENGIIQNLEEIFTYNQGDNGESPSQHDGKPGTYTIGIEEDGRLSAEADGVSYTVAYDPGILTVRYVTDPEGILDGNVDIAMPVQYSVEAFDNGDTSMAVGVVKEGTVFKTNGKTAVVGLTEEDTQGKISLLCDTILSLGADGRDRSRELTARVEEYLEENGYSLRERQYDYRYLDLINEYDGNIWVSSSEGVDVYYPYPEGTSYENSDQVQFTVLHFLDLHREYGFRSEEQIEDLIASCEIEVVQAETTEHGIKFHVPESGFSPFAVTWQPAQYAGGQTQKPSGKPQGNAAQTGDVRSDLYAAVCALLLLGSAFAAGRSIRKRKI